LLNAGTRDPFPTRAREDSFTVVFSASKIFSRNLRNSAKRCANPFTPDPPLKTACATPRVKKRFLTRHFVGVIPAARQAFSWL